MHHSTTATRAALAFALFTGFAAKAQAQGSADACASSYESAQRERGRGALLEASQAARACSQPECPAFLAQECIKLYEQIQADLPTTVFSAKNGRGEELVDVTVQIDGKTVTQHLDGRPIELNPGLHTFHFESAGLPAYELKQTARIGDHNRLMEVMLGPIERPATPVQPVQSQLPPPSAPVEPVKHGSYIPAASFVLGGVGVIGLGAFAGLRLSASSDYNDLSRNCSPRCDPSKVDPIRTKYTLSYVALGVGAAAVAASVIVYVVANGHPSSETTVAVLPSADGLQARLSTHF